MRRSYPIGAALAENQPCKRGPAAAALISAALAADGFRNIAERF